MKRKHLWTGKRKPFQPRICNSDSSATSLLLTYQDYLDLSNNCIKFTPWMCWKGFFIICTILLHENSVWKGTNKSGLFCSLCSAWQISINLAGQKGSSATTPASDRWQRQGAGSPRTWGAHCCQGTELKNVTEAIPASICLLSPVLQPTAKPSKNPFKVFFIQSWGICQKRQTGGHKVKRSVFTALTQLIINHSQVA